MHSMSELKPCKVCGKLFKSIRSTHVYCSGDCNRKAERQRQKRDLKYNAEKQREYKAKKKLEKAEKERKKHALTEMAKKAREAGMSYGQYVAMMEGAMK